MAKEHTRCRTPGSANYSNGSNKSQVIIKGGPGSWKPMVFPSVDQRPFQQAVLDGQ